MRTLSLLAVVLLATAAFGQDVDVFARGLEEISSLAVLEDGTVLAARPSMHDVLALRDRDHDGRADDIRTAVLGVPTPLSLATHGRTLYIASAENVVAAERRADGSFGATKDVVDRGGTIGVSPDGRLFVASSDGTLRQLEGSDYLRVYARGLRGLSGFAWHPKTRELMAAGGQRIADGMRYDVTLSPATLVFDGEGNAIEVTPAAIKYAGPASAGRSIDIGPATAGPPLLAGAAMMSDGALLVADASGIIYRIGTRIAPMTSAANELPQPPVLAKAFRAAVRHATAVVHDEEQDVYFVAHAGGIAHVSPEGKVEPFIEGVRSPAALAVRGTELWIADGDTLRVFDRVTGADVKMIAIKGAVALRGLAVGRDNLVYVTDSGVRTAANGQRERAANGRVYRIDSQGNAETMLNGEELRAPSGIAFDDTRFVVAQSYGRELLAWNLGAETNAVARGPGAFEGVVVLPTGALLVASQHDDTIYFATSAGGDLRPLLSRKFAPAGIGFDRKRNRLLIPSPDDDSLEVWTLPPLDTASTSTDVTKTPPRALSAATPRRTSRESQSGLS